MLLEIVHYNSSVLRQKGVRVPVFDGNIARLAADMIATMHEAAGIGLAAQQVGRALQFCVIDLRETDRDFYWELNGVQTPLDLIMPMALANPVIEPLPSEKTVYEEGCLSFPGIRGDVSRPDRIRVTFQDTQGTSHTLMCNGLFARCIQHEFDHLQGTLFIDRRDKAIRRPLELSIKALADQTKAAALEAAGKLGAAPVSSEAK